VLAGLHKALVHVVRNSVAHGIESHAQRLGSGKPQVGVIDIAFERRGHRVLVRCTDDGRGLDLEAIKRVVVSRGLISPEQATTIDQVALEELLLSGGVSTSPTVTDVSGRGVGLEAVRHAVQALKGELKLHSRVGRGTTVEILVPLSLSAMPALAVHCERTTALIPLDSVRQALRVTPSDVVRQEDGERVVVGGQVIPFLPLARALDRSDARASESHSAVILEAQGQLAAIGVDKLGAARSVVVRAIPEHADLNPVVSGAAFNDEGNIDLVLAPPALIRAAMDAEPLTPPVQAERPRILVIDDSLTTRMLEQSILEAAGYQVDLAVSGEEGLAKARTTRYGLFIVDVEMPGMSGFEFVSTVKADAELGATPCILVTSRAAASDRRRGKEVGARAYIVKSEFNQAELLETVARFLDD